jgi:phage gp36-like protein
MSYASPSDMISRYPNRDLVQLTNEDPSATTVNTAALELALNDASAEIDGYLQSRYTLPLNEPPAALPRLVSDIAMYRLQSLRPLHDVADARKRYEDAVALLVRVARGDVTLGLAADDASPAAAGSAVTQAGGDSGGILPTRIFDRRSLKDPRRADTSQQRRAQCELNTFACEPNGWTTGIPDGESIARGWYRLSTILGKLASILWNRRQARSSLADWLWSISRPGTLT